MPTPFSWTLGTQIAPAVDRGCLGKTSVAVPRPITPGNRPFRGPAAMMYDGASKDWLINADGRYKSVHPVDQGVVLSVLSRQGSIKSSPTTGSTLHEVEYLGGPELASDVDDRVKRSNPLARYLKSGAVTLKRVDVESSGSRLFVVVYYVNNLVNPNDQQSVQYYH